MAPQVTMWFVILLFGMQMTRGLCENCCLHGSFFKTLGTIGKCRPGIFSLFVMETIVTIFVIAAVIGWGLLSVWHLKKGRACREENIIQTLKKCYEILNQQEISLTGECPCSVLDQHDSTTYEDLLTTNNRLDESRRVLFLGNSEVSQYILREWSYGNILEHQVLIYVKDGEESCILQLVKNILNTDDTDYLLEVLKQIPVIVLINLDRYSTKRDQVGEKIIDVDQLLKDNISQFPSIKVWATSGAKRGNHGFLNSDVVVQDGETELLK